MPVESGDSLCHIHHMYRSERQTASSVSRVVVVVAKVRTEGDGMGRAARHPLYLCSQHTFCVHCGRVVVVRVVACVRLF